MFSPRVPSNRSPNRLAQAVAQARAQGRTLLDLTGTNPTIAGFDYPAALLHPLASAAALVYEPQPFGLRGAREAVARDYRRRGISVASERLVLTASTSEAYSLLFKLLCRPEGDAVLVPTPSYPLFDHLARLEGVEALPYRLEYHGRWSVDPASVDAAWTHPVRAVLGVSPNNPTGSVLSAAELEDLTARCTGRDAALILDEVFAEYPLDGHTTDAMPSPASSRNAAATLEPQCLTFRLGGLSKSAGLPQVKLAWICVSGPDALVADALDRLEVICDTYLSVSTPVQLALPELLASAPYVREQIAARVRRNYHVLGELASVCPRVERLNADGGWSAVLRIPAVGPEEQVVLDLLARASVLVHPGYFFDFPHEAFLVMSLLTESDTFVEGVRRIMECIGD